MRKLILFVFIIIISAPMLSGQVRYEDIHPLKFFFEGDVRSGQFSDIFNATSLSAGYSNPLNSTTGGIEYTAKSSFSAGLQAGYYFNHKRTLGLGIGMLYSAQSGSISTDQFHVEYMAFDFDGNTFRQLITSNGPISETVKSSNLSIPFFFRYKKVIDEDMFFTFDGGILYNLLQQNKYTGNAGFDYEAIYKIEGSGANLTYVYDNAATPGGTDWLITRNNFLKDNPNGDIQAYFKSLQGIGYNVGLGDTVKKTGKIKYGSKSVGFIFQPSLNYKIRDGISGKAGLYISYQSFANTSYSGSAPPLSDRPGDYNSLLNFSKTFQNLSYGFSFGINFYL